jgi:hypothetical protein
MVVMVKIRVKIFLNGQFIIVYTCKPHINHKYSLGGGRGREVFALVEWGQSICIDTTNLKPIGLI